MTASKPDVPETEQSTGQAEFCSHPDRARRRLDESPAGTVEVYCDGCATVVFRRPEATDGEVREAVRSLEDSPEQ